MNVDFHIPDSVEDAISELQSTFGITLGALPKERFVRVWTALCYLNPGLHPDDFDESDCGWPSELQPYAVEAWRRVDAGGLSDEELYPSDATWAGIFDRFDKHTPLEVARRAEIAQFGRRS